MRLSTIVLVSSLALASVMLVPAASANPCDPRDGPFAECYWLCEPGWEPECRVLIGTGQRVWNYYCDRVDPSC